jgi:NAD(P)-dependent dehydrogenase (short-subunit alcohol dehydrogenase family)
MPAETGERALRLKGKNAVITAAASGMGLAGARLFAREGARLVLVDVNAGALDAAVAELKDMGADVHPLVVDLGDLGAARAMVHDAAALVGGVDVLWNHAGIACPVDIVNLDMAAYDRSHAINVTSALIAAGQASEVMKAGRGGSIIFTASTAGLVGSAYSPIYSAQKFAVIGMMMGMAQRFAKDGIRVNAICPGPIDTPMLPTFFARPGETLSQDELDERVRTGVAASVPMGRPGRPDEIGQAAVWLASDESSFVTGVALPVDGGYTSR